MVKIAHAGHHLFACNFNDDAIVAVESAISNLVIEKTTAALLAVEPESRDFLEKVSSFASHLANTPSGRRLIGLSAQPAEQVDGDPIFANIEITRRCDLTCRYCARTLTGISADDMSLETFRTLLSKLPHAYRITLVGLGEPLLHPQLVEMVSLAANQGRRIALVTNAMALDDRLTSQLLEVGLDSIAFSIDAADPDLVSQMRPGSDIQRITSNIRRFTDQARRLDRPISMAVFSAISREGVSDLSALVRLVGTLGVHVLMLSDLNFAENVTASLSAAPEAEISQPVRDAVSAAFACNLPVLTVRALEEFGLAARYQDALLLPTEQLYRRSSRHRFCHSPWQTLSVNVRGDVALCDCQPESLIGNILEQPLAELWNSTELCSHRRQMRSDSPPKACRICPRF
jgi:radical SAM protein with 4Fe4S-binding SPASM domain